DGGAGVGDSGDVPRELAEPALDAAEVVDPPVVAEQPGPVAERLGAGLVHGEPGRRRPDRGDRAGRLHRAGDLPERLVGPDRLGAPEADGFAVLVPADAVPVGVEDASL